MGLVAKYVGWQYATLLYIVDFIVVIIIGKMLSLADLNKETELIIELHDFRVPNFKVILIQTWNRSKEFVIIALPLIVVLGIWNTDFGGTKYFGARLILYFPQKTSLLF